MASLRNRNAVLLAKIESSEGVDASPSASTDAVLVENIKITKKPNMIKTNEVTGSLDGFGDIVGGMPFGLSFDVYLKGSGAAGSAPEWGKLLKACGWAETITATAVPAAAEACAAGGSTTTAVLGASASSSAQAYRGMPITLTGVVAGSSFISDYTAGKVATLTDTMGGAIVATTNYQIPINVLYKPASSSISSLTFYIYIDGVVYKAFGGRGTVKLSLTSGGVGKLSFDFKAMFGSKSDAAVPTPTYDSTRPPVFKSAVMLINRLAAAINSFNLDNGNTTAQADNPNAAEGFDPAEITGRDITGSVDPKETLIATRDIMTDLRAGTKRIIHARYGATTGNKVGITIPQALYNDEDSGDREGIATVNVPFQATGQDAGAFICLY
jgi:hypothetical protein